MHYLKTIEKMKKSENIFRQMKMEKLSNPVGCSKRVSKRNNFNHTGFLKNQEKHQIKKKTNLPSRKLEKQTKKPKVSRRKEKIEAENKLRSIKYRKKSMKQRAVFVFFLKKNMSKLINL